MSDAWDPEQYHRYRRYRRAPFEDLLDMVAEDLRQRAGIRAIDLGCGSGELTRVLHERLEDAVTVGLDRSASMLSRATASTTSGLVFRQGDIADWLATIAADDDAERWDLVYSNAALHWLEDHASLMPKLFEAVRPGGQLLFQVPANDYHASHTTILEIAAESPFVEALGGWSRRTPVLAPHTYAELLDRAGAIDIQVRLEVYPQHLDTRDDVVEWVRGSTLTPYAERLGPQLHAEFVEACRARLREKLPDERPFFYPYDRIFVSGRRARDTDSERVSASN